MGEEEAAVEGEAAPSCVEAKEERAGWRREGSAAFFPPPTRSSDSRKFETERLRACREP
jgi:hypothetical protein